MKRTAKRRTARGASIILVALFAIGLIILVFIAFQFAMVMGGSREVRNAVDAGALNMAKRTQEIQFPVAGGFGDVANTSGQVGISNISRVLGKAFLINANVQDIQNTGGLNGNVTAAGETAYEAAKEMNDNLANALKAKGTLDNYFNDMALAKNAKLLGDSATVTSQTQDQQSSNSKDQQQATNFATAMVDRGDESNLSFSPVQLPKGVNLTPVQKGNKNFMQGYVPLTANGKEFVLPTFHLGEQPHLISDDYFQKNRSDTNGVQGNPIPNAFRESGLVNGSNNALTASASAVANPQRQYSLAIPFAYTTITFGNRAIWFMNGKPIKQTPYGNEPVQQYEIKHYMPLPTSGGFMDGGANLGNEYKAQNLWMLYNNTLEGDHTTPLNKLVQRMQEVDPTFNLAKLTTLLNQQSVKQSEQPVRYFIYPTYTSADHTDPKITIGEQTSGNLPPWLSKAAAEGDFVPLTNEEPKKNEPNTNFDTITGGKYNVGNHWTTFNGQIGWHPGTGFSQCLGDLQILRVTSLYFTDQPEN